VPQSEAPSQVRSFEIHTKHLGEWKFDSNYDDLELAMEEARKLDGRNVNEYVRVIEEVFDDSPVSKIRVVYTTEPVEGGKNSLSDGRTFGSHGANTEPEDDVADYDAPVDDEDDDSPAARYARRKSGQSPIMLGIILVLILAFGLAVLLGLEYLIAMSETPPDKKAGLILPLLLG
jgi:hypothetical protein